MSTAGRDHPIRVQVLYFEGCPNHEPTRRRIEEMAAEDGIRVTIEPRRVDPGEDPHALRFLGSPTVLVDGQDIDPSLRESAQYGFGCRTFRGATVPSDTMIRSALDEAATGAERSKQEAAGSEPEGATSCPATPHSAPKPTAASEARRSSAGLLASGAAVGAAALASICCWGPLLLLATGISFSAAGLIEALAPWRPLLLAAAVVLLGLGFYGAYFGKGAATAASCCTPLDRVHRGGLWPAAGAVLAFALLPLFSGALFGSGESGTTAGPTVDATAEGQVRTYKIDGMTCESCAPVVEDALAELPGVVSCDVSYEKRRARVRASGEQPTDTAVEKAVSDAGFSATRAATAAERREATEKKQREDGKQKTAKASQELDGETEADEETGASPEPQWGPEKNGLQTALIPLAKKVPVGRLSAYLTFQVRAK